jgi:Putative zinc-finger
MIMSFLHDIKMILSLSCDESSRLVSDDLERPLSRAERLALRLHLMVCNRCRKFRRNLRLLRTLLRRRAEQCLADTDLPPVLAPDERARILKTLTGAQSEES